MKSCKEEEDDGGLWSQRGHSSKCFWMKNRRTKKQGNTRIPKQDFIAVDQSRVSFVSLPKPKNAVQSTRNNSFLVVTLTVLSTAILLALIIFAVYAKLSKNVVAPACATSEQNQEAYLNSLDQNELDHYAKTLPEMELPAFLKFERKRNLGDFQLRV